MIKKNLNNCLVLILRISSHLTNTFQNYVKRQAKNYMYLSKNKLRLIMNTFLRPSYTIVHLSGCSTIEDKAIR